jgi:hypothetical protein
LGAVRGGDREDAGTFAGALSHLDLDFLDEVRLAFDDPQHRLKTQGGFSNRRQGRAHAEASREQR